MFPTITPIRKTRVPTTREERLNSVQMFLKEAVKLGVSEAWLIGSMAKGNDHSLSDVDLLVKGKFQIEHLYILRDKIFSQTSVIIMIYTGELKNRSKLRLW